jgi:hypothetical protein
MCSDAPDMSGVNNAAEQTAAVGAEQLKLAREQMAKAETRQASFDPKFQAILDASLASQKTSDARSEEQWQQYLKIGMPAENRLAETAANYDTAGRRDEAAAAARAGVEREGAAAREDQNRALGRAGISLSSGRALTLDNASRLAQSKSSVGAAQAARDKVEATGMSLTDNVAKFGRGLTSTGLQAAQLALSGGGAAGNTLGGQQSTYNASLAPAAQAYGGATSAFGQSGQMFGQIASMQQQANQSNSAGLDQLAGTAMMFMSSKELKEDLGDVDPEAALEAVRKPKVKAWRYLGRSEVEIGPMAEDVHEASGMGNGKSLSVITELGTLRGAVQALADRMDKSTVKRVGRRSLSDVRGGQQHEVA